MLFSNSVSLGSRRARTPSLWPPLFRVCLAAVLALGFALDTSSQTWRGLTVAPRAPLRSVRQETRLSL